MRWFRGPKGVSCYHMMNAFEDADGRIQFDQCLSNVNAFPFIQRASGLNVAPEETGARLARWTIDLSDGSDRVTETVIGPPGDLPVIPAASQGRPYTHGWMLDHEPARCRARRSPAARWARCSTCCCGSISPAARRRRWRCRRGTASTSRCTCRPRKPGMRAGC